MNDTSINNKTISLPFLSENDKDMKLDAHISNNMKVKRPKIVANNLSSPLPIHNYFSDKEATKKMQSINTDIYEGAVKEKEKHEFNLKRYFTIFGIIALITAAITYFRKK